MRGGLKKRKREWNERRGNIGAYGRRPPNWTTEESDYSLNLKDHLLQKNDHWKGDDINNDTQRRPLDDREKRRNFEGKKHPSQSPVCWRIGESHEQSEPNEESGSESGELSQSHRNLTAEYWRKGGERRFIHDDFQEGNCYREYRNSCDGGKEKLLKKSRRPTEVCRDRSIRHSSFDSEIKLEGHLGGRLCNFFAMGNCVEGDYCRFSHKSPSDRHLDGQWKNDRNNGGEIGPTGHGFRRETHRSTSTLCKNHAMGKCRNGEQCSFSHDVHAHSEAKSQSKHEKEEHGMDTEDIKMGKGSTWDDIVAVSHSARSTGWDIKETGFISCANAPGERVIAFNDKKQWNWPAWDNSAVILKRSKSRHGNVDVENMKFTDKTATDDPTYQTIGDVNLRSNVKSTSTPGHKPESRGGGDTLCTSFARGNCRDRDRCSHGGSTHGNSECLSPDPKWKNSSDNGKKSRSGSTWDDFYPSSQATKSTGWESWGNSDAMDIKVNVPAETLNQNRAEKVLDDENVSPDIHEPESHKKEETSCKYFATSKCHDGHLSMFSHGRSTYRNSKIQSQEEKWKNDFENGKKLWNGPTRGGACADSRDAKSTVWGSSGGWDTNASDIVAMNSNENQVDKGLNGSCDSSILKDRDIPSNEHESLKMVIGSGHAIKDAHESIVIETAYVKEYPESPWELSQSQKPKAFNDVMKAWNGPRWNDNNVSWDASVWSKQGNIDAAKLKVTDEMAAPESIYHREGRSNGTYNYLRSNRSDRSSHGHKPESHENGHTICRSFARGKCRDGDRCRFSHEGSTQKKSKRLSRDDKRKNVSDNVKKFWNGRTWNDFGARMQDAKSSGSGSSDGWDNNATDVLTASSIRIRVDKCLDNENRSRDSQIVKDKAAVTNEHQFVEMPSGSGSAIDDVPKSMLVEKVFLKEDPQSTWVSSQSRKVRKHVNTDAETTTVPNGMATEASSIERTCHRLKDTPDNILLRSNRNSCLPKYPERGDTYTLCKYFSRGNCRDGDRCRFSHADSIHKKSNCQSRDGTRENDSDNGEKLWNGPTWNDVSVGSQAAKLTGWGNSDAKDMTSANSEFNRLDIDLDDSSISRGSRVLSDIRVVPKSSVAKKVSFQVEPQSMRVPSPSQKFDGTKDSDKLWNGPTSNDTSVVKYLNNHKNHHTSHSYERVNNVCKYFASGKCRDGGRCRFSHGTSTHTKPNAQSGVSKLENMSHNDKKLWDAATRDAVSTVSLTSKSTGWGNINADKVVLEDTDAKRDELAKGSVHEVPRSISWACLQSQRMDEVDLPHCVDVMPETSIHHLGKTITRSILSGSSTVELHSTDRSSSEDEVICCEKITHTAVNKSFKTGGADRSLRPVDKTNSSFNKVDSSKIKAEGQHSNLLKNQNVDITVKVGIIKENENEMQLLRNVLVEFVKVTLAPTREEGRISKDVYKTIVKKVVDKVCGTIKGKDIPKTREDVDYYMSYSRPSIAKLVQAYVDIYPKV